MDFILPSPNNRDDVLSFYNEFKNSGSTCIGFNGYDEYDSWLSGMHNRHTGACLPEGYVRENFYLCYDNERLIGVFSLKFELTEYLLNYGGHIGYAVRPSEQNKGYATRMLEHGLLLAKRLGFERVLCICDNDNYPSEKVILKNGGVFENELYDPDDCVFVRRYWIQL